MNQIFKGLITAIITPFKDDKIDFISLRKILEHQIEHNVDGVVLAGSTGEGNSLDIEEYKLLIKNAVEIVKQRIPVIAGCCAISTSSTIRLAQIAAEGRADGLMCTVPPYVKPTQEGLYRHFQAIHDATNLPIILYSAPGRASSDFTNDTILRLSELPRIIALKDGNNDLDRLFRLKAKLPKHFNMIAGNDYLNLAYNSQGGAGCISVASNIVPQLCKKIQDNWKNGNLTDALKIDMQLLTLYKALFVESNPIPVKYAVHYLGLCFNELRLPLTEAQNTTKEQIEQAIKDVMSLKQELRVISKI